MCGPEEHLKKAGTPTMGGLMILVSVCISTLLWSDLTNRYVWYAMLVMLGYGLIGFADDYLKLTKNNSKGLPGKIKILGTGLYRRGSNDRHYAGTARRSQHPYLHHHFSKTC